MKNTLSTRRKPGRARAKRRLRRSSRIRIAAVAVADDSLAKESPTTTVREGTRIIDPRVDAIVGGPVVAGAVNNASTGPATEFGDALISHM